MKDKNNINELINTKANEEKIENNISPKVSIIVPIYNVEKYLRQCLDSIVNQTLKDIEIILVDDGSTDSCPSICDEYASKDKRIIVIHKENAGLGAAYNTGLDIAKGDYIGFVESDDFIELNMYEELYKRAVESGVEVVKTCVALVKNDGADKVVFNKFPAQLHNKIIYEKDPRFALGQIHHWAALYSAKIIQENNIRFTQTKGAAAQDVGFAFKIFIYMSSFYLITKPLYNYRIDRADASRHKQFQMALSVYNEFSLLYKYLKNINANNDILDIFAKHLYDSLHHNYINRSYIFQKYKYSKLCSMIFNELIKENIHFKYFDENKKKIFLQIAEEPTKFFIKNLIIQSKTTKDVSSINLFNLPIYFNKRTKGYQSFRIFHIPIYRAKTMGNTYKRYFFLIPYFKKITTNDMIYKYLFVFLYNETPTKLLNSADILGVVGNTLLCEKLHSKTFPKYKNKHLGQDIAIFATGPSLYFAPKDFADINIACNRAIEESDNFAFDYFFAIDYEATRDYLEKSFDMNLVRFLGRYTYNSGVSIPECVRQRGNAESYYTSIGIEGGRVNHGIEVFPLADFGTVVHHALHFALYTHPKRIFLLGCDTSNEGYHKNYIQTKPLDVERLVGGYKKFKDYISSYYPDIELISINPVGLRGIFKDLYTRDFVESRNDIDKDEVEFFEDFIKREKI